MSEPKPPLKPDQPWGGEPPEPEKPPAFDASGEAAAFLPAVLKALKMEVINGKGIARCRAAEMLMQLAGPEGRPKKAKHTVALTDIEGVNGVFKVVPKTGTGA